MGIKEGGRTGLVAVTIALCFGLSVFFAPFLQSIPQVGLAAERESLGQRILHTWGCNARNVQMT